ncbi:MAG: glucose-6-phosphate dehydrogenase [Armatimonadota bacterium]
MAEKGIERHLLVVIGGTGDLMRSKLLPAMRRLTEQGALRDKVILLAAGRRTSFDDRSYRDWAREALAEAGRPIDAGDSGWCERCLHYESVGEQTREGFERLRRRIEQLEHEHGLPGNRTFYLATPPGAFIDTIECLGEVGLNDGPGWTRVVIEKPFGHDLESARTLNERIHRYFREDQIYRIDHYLGKETVQNLLTFRFANTLFESIWNRDRVASVEINVAESVGVGERGESYDSVGAIRDIVQNHLTQLLALTAMEAPVEFAADPIRDEKVKVLRSIAPIDPGQVVRGQYAAGEIDGERVPGYREERGVAPNSDTETYVALRLHISNWRWHGVPFVLCTGKRLPEKRTSIIVNFRCPVLAIFQAHTQATVRANSLVVTLQPDEGFDLHFEIKQPGDPLRLQTHSLRFRYKDAFPELPEAYETLLVDIAQGDQTLFVRADEVEQSWRVYAPLLQLRGPVHPYPAGTAGPQQAQRIMVPRGEVCPL